MFFRNKNYTRSIIRLAIPVALQNLITAILNIFDQIMVGNLNSSNVDAYLSAVLLVGQIIFIYQIILFATANTVNIFIAQYSAQGEIKLIPQRVGLALLINVVATLLVTLLCVIFPDFVISLFDADPKYHQYAVDFLALVAWSFLPMAVSMTFSYVLRAIKRMTVPLVCSIIAVGCNIALNYLFMFVLDYGFLGAAYGTIVSRVIELVLVLGGMWWKRYPVVARPSTMFKVDKKFNKQFFVMFIPIVLNEVCWAVSNAVYMFVYDKQPNSDAILAAVNITSTVDKVLSVIMIGVGAAACIIMGNVIATNDRPKIKQYAHYSVQFGVVAGLLVGILTIISAFFAPQMFPQASQFAKQTATNLIIIYGLSAIFRSLGYMLIVGILRSGGDTTFTMVAEICVVWILSVPAVLVSGLVLKANIYVMTIIIMIAEFIKVAICYWRMRTGKWIKLVLTNDSQQTEESTAVTNE